MTFWNHLDELRAVLVRCLILFFVGFLIAYFFSDSILAWLREPLFKVLPPERQHLYYTNLFENFLIHLKVSGYASLLLLSPVYFLLLWRFIAPGLRPQERNAALPFAVAASLFFILGAAFAYYVLFPKGVKYFLSYGTTAEVPWLTLDSYISLIIKLLMGFGFCFELPVVLVLLARIGLLTPDKLIHNRKTAIIIITVLAALVAPPDAISMLLLMAPLYLLYEGAIVFISRIHKNRLNPPNTK